MPTEDRHPLEQKPGAGAFSTLKLGRVLGIEIRIHLSVLVIFMLIVSGLAATLFPSWHPDWSALQSWSAATVAALLFFVSLLIHELSHSVVARRCGIEISSITLFLFGGMAEMRGEPETPKDEFLVAGAGPLASFALAFIFGVLASFFIPDTATLSEEMDFTQLSATATIFTWLSTINLLLATFNLLPGFPMDGGRLFRAALWWRTGDLVRATQVAARVGGGFGWAFMALGALQVFGGNTINGLWFVLIGWFIRRLALASVSNLMLDQALRGFNVSAVMRTRFEKVPASLTLGQFVDDYLLRSSQQLWPVVDAKGDIGFITTASFDPEVQSSERPSRQLADFIQPLDEENCITPDISAHDAFQRLANHAWPLPVVEAGRIIGIIHQADILRWFSFHKIPT
jgi:Zn-dependent protease